MKLLILGATGRVGRLLVDAALAQDHEVVAFVRNPAKLKITSPRLAFFKGDARDPQTVAAAMARVDAVLSTLGHKSLKKSDIQTAATRAVLAAIKPHQRFISLTGTDVPDPRDPPRSFGRRIMALIIKLIPGEVYLDGLRHVQLLRASDADWVVVRAPTMMPGPATHRYDTGYIPIGFAATATRADIADFMLVNLTTNQWLRQAPAIRTIKS